MKTTIDSIPHADEPQRTVAQWLFETESGEFIAGGYADDENRARNDAAIWIKGKKVTISCDCHWTDDDNQERITPGPCTGTVSAIDFREDATLIDVHLDAGGYFTYERSADGDVLSVEGQTASAVR